MSPFMSAAGVVTPSSVLYAAYVEYCAREAAVAVGKTVFGRALGALGFVRDRSKEARSWQDLRLLELTKGGDR